MADTRRKQGQKNSDTIESLNLIYGKVPPQEPELERAVLGALLIQTDAIFNIMDILKPASFYDPIHQMIYQSVLDLGTSHKPVDIMTVAHDLKTKEQLDIIGGEVYLSELTDRLATASHLEFHARIVHQKYVQRELIKASAEIQKRSFDASEDVEELINFAESEIFKISEGNIKSETQKIGIILNQAIEAIERAAKDKSQLLGTPSGFTKLDRITSGWQPADLIFIAARPSMGKTAFVLSMARNMAVDYEKPIAIFSLEMASIQLVNRLISAEVEIRSEKIRLGELKDYEWQQLESRVKNLENAPMFIDDSPAISVFELRAKCRRLARTHGISAIIIDYLQLMTAGVDMKGNREQEVSTISRSLKAIAKELSVPVIALSQLNRSVESRSGDKRPQLSDLRESGAIEQDADMVLFIHRPEYYGITTDSDGQSLLNMAEIIIAKHRNGATGSVHLKFKKEFAKFMDLPDSIDGLDSEDTVKFKSRMNGKEGFELNDDIPMNSGFESDSDESSPF
jgi:replicative DNA helicase